MRSGPICEFGNVRIGGEGDQVSCQVRREDLQKRRENLADAPEPELILECFIDSP